MYLLLIFRFVFGFKLDKFNIDLSILNNKMAQ